MEEKASGDPCAVAVRFAQTDLSLTPGLTVVLLQGSGPSGGGCHSAEGLLGHWTLQWPLKGHSCCRCSGEPIGGLALTSGHTSLRHTCIVNGDSLGMGCVQEVMLRSPGSPQPWHH